MAINLSSNISLQMVLNATGVGTLANLSALLNRTDTIQYANGNGSEQANQIYAATLTGTGDVTLELNGGGGALNPFNEVIDLAVIRALYIKNNATTSGYTLSVGAAGSNPVSGMFGDVSDIAKVTQGGILFWTFPKDGIAVDGTHLNLKIARGGNSIPYDLVIIGS